MKLIGTKISKSYGTQKVLDEVDLSIGKGQIVGLLGLNGAGKTTLLKILAGINQPDDGSVNIGQASIGYLSEQNPLYPHMYVQEYLHWIGAVGKVGNRSEVIHRLIDQIGLSEVLGKKISQISKGYRQRVGLAAVMISDPDIILLDEPINGLDPVQIEQYRSYIKSVSKNKITLLSSHLIQEIEALCDRVYVLKNASLTEEDMDCSDHSGYQLRVTTNSACDMSALVERDIAISVDSDSNNQYVITSATNAPIEEAVFDYIVDAGCKIVEMKRLDSSLTKLLES